MKRRDAAPVNEGDADGTPDLAGHALPALAAKVIALSERESQVKKIVFNPSTLAPAVGHFERAVRLGDFLFISGTSALTNVSGPIEERRLVNGIVAQTHETIDNIDRVLQAAGGYLHQIYELRLILKKREYFAAVDQVLKERLPDKGFICHAYEGVLLHPDMEIEIEANAYLGVENITLPKGK